jgi:DNA topoisomerase VI subunit B
MTAHLERTAFTTDRVLEFFTEAELTMQIGYGRRLWPLVLAKELIDNALDACETVDKAPAITLTLKRDALIIEDNGPGIPTGVIERSLDYQVRISDKKGYLSPTRGQLGNALKCVWAAPFVADGERGLVEVTAGGLLHRIEVSLDRIAQKPVISHAITPLVKKGNTVKVHWNGIASCGPNENQEFYQTETLAEAVCGLMADFSALNPHATFAVNVPGRHQSFEASDPAWRKWRANQPTSSHWYRAVDLRALIAAYINEADRPVRDFVSEFNCLSGTQVRKAVLAEARISAGSSLRDLVVNGDVDMTAVERLLSAMQRHSKSVDPARLGVIGKEHLQAALRALGATGFKYKRIAATDDGLPFVIEIAFGVKKQAGRRLIVGLNWSPVLKVPSGHLSDALSSCHVHGMIKWSC